MAGMVSFDVRPSVPASLAALEKLAFNLLWCWDRDAIDLFRRLDEDLWDSTFHNPVLMLGRMPQQSFARLLEDESFMDHLNQVTEKFEQYLADERTWFRKFYDHDMPLFAYFSAEFGLTECLKIYSGGLGILAGDSLKSASDLGVPIVGVGLLYQEGYFRQYLNADGWQQERCDVNDFSNLPVRPLLDGDGKPMMISLRIEGREVRVRCWSVEVGRVPLFLLDTNIHENAPRDQEITSNLYGGDLEMRIKQEMVLGIGGVRMLKSMGLDPIVYHMNEGHSAFLALERARQLMRERGLSFEEAKEIGRSGNVFTTHTPVIAGIDEFPPDMIEKYFGDYISELGIDMPALLALGRVDGAGSGEPFNMARLAIREAARVNSVSRLHRKVTRKMWSDMWSDVPFQEIPVEYVTNGIHIPSWVSHDMATLLDRYLGPGWVERPTDETVWDGVHKIPDSELWRTHERRRERLVAFARSCLKRQLENREASSEELKRAEEVLDPSALTIGFARRFATYKRATLILEDKARLKRILESTDRPVQFIFAGKAHPKDSTGKEFIRQVLHFARQEEMRNHITFIEDYNMIVSRYLVEGVDVWLNTPLRPMEASGTSGMKVVPNGGLNLSILDGWWDEAHSPDVGWAIGKGESYGDIEYQNKVESNALYDILEREVIPLFYSRGRDGLPRGWIRTMKQSMRSLCHVFNTDRMVKQYVNDFYLPAIAEFNRLSGDNSARARDLASWKRKTRECWNGIEILDLKANIDGNERVGALVPVEAVLRLGALGPDDVTVEAFYGLLDEKRFIRRGCPIELKPARQNEDGTHVYAGDIGCEDSGKYGLTIRVVPSRSILSNPFQLNLITWL
jgi:starch phosphorylase